MNNQPPTKRWRAADHLFVEVRNIHGVKSSIETLETTYARRPVTERPDLLVLIETMAAERSRWSLRGYRVLGLLHATKTKVRGRPSGGAAILVRDTLSAPVQRLVTGREPPDCVVVIIGDSRSAKAVALVVFYRSPSADIPAYFLKLDSLTDHLIVEGYKVIAACDSNAHLASDTPITGIQQDDAGDAWTEWARKYLLRRLTPPNDHKWTFYNMTAASYRDTNFNHENGRSIVDQVAAHPDAESSISDFWLDNVSHMHADHVGLCLSIRSHGEEGKPFTPLPRPSQPRVHPQSPTATSYRSLSEPIIRNWMRTALRQPSRWTDPPFVANHIRKLENDLIRTMDTINPKRFRGPKGQRRSTKSRPKKSALASMHRLTYDDQAVVAERKQVDDNGSLLSTLVGDARQQEVWKLKASVQKCAHSPPPRALFKDGLLLWRHDEVLHEVRRGVEELCQPIAEHLLGPPDRLYREQIRSRHRTLCRLARGARDWTPIEDNAATLLKYLVRVFRENGACGKSGFHAALIALLDEALALELLLLMTLIAACGTVPAHWLPTDSSGPQTRKTSKHTLKLQTDHPCRTTIKRPGESAQTLLRLRSSLSTAPPRDNGVQTGLLDRHRTLRSPRILPPRKLRRKEGRPGLRRREVLLQRRRQIQDRGPRVGPPPHPRPTVGALSSTRGQHHIPDPLPWHSHTEISPGGRPQPRQSSLRHKIQHRNAPPHDGTRRQARRSHSQRQTNHRTPLVGRPGFPQLHRRPFRQIDSNRGLLLKRGISNGTFQTLPGPRLPSRQALGRVRKLRLRHSRRHPMRREEEIPPQVLQVGGQEF